MKDNLKFAITKSYPIKNENVRGILFDINALKSDDTVADIADLNKIRFDLTLKRQGRKEPIVIFKGFLQNFLNILYQQNTMLEIVTKKLNSGYKVLLRLKQTIHLEGEDELEMTVNFPTSAFTSSVASKSTVDIETIQSEDKNIRGLLSVYETFVPEVGKSSYDKNIGGNIKSILLEVDNAATLDASAKAKPEDVDITSDTFNDNKTLNALIALNQSLLHFNPESDVKNLWLYMTEQTLLQNTSLRIKFDKPVDASSLIQVERLMYA